MPLAELQRDMARALLSGDMQSMMGHIAVGPIPAEAALLVHRNTVLGGLAGALRLTFPTVDKLVGKAFLDQAAAAYAQETPPGEAAFTRHAAVFPAFLQRYPRAACIAYLADAARFDLAIHDAGAAPLDGEGVDTRLDEATRLALSPSLRIESFVYPVDEIRDALDSQDEQRLAAIDIEPRPLAFAVWRGAAGAVVRPLSPPSAAFLSALIAGAPADEALEQALAGQDADAFTRLQAEVFGAGFASIHTHQAEGDTP